LEKKPSETTPPQKAFFGGASKDERALEANSSKKRFGRERRRIPLRGSEISLEAVPPSFSKKDSLRKNRELKKLLRGGGKLSHPLRGGERHSGKKKNKTLSSRTLRKPKISESPAPPSGEGGDPALLRGLSP